MIEPAFTLDIDSSILTRYGDSTEGAKRGYTAFYTCRKSPFKSFIFYSVLEDSFSCFKHKRGIVFD